MAIPGKHTENGVYEFEYMRKPDNSTRWERVKLGIWNPETHEFMGRNAKSWAGIITFYLIFYAVLAALFAICMYAWLGTLSLAEPKWKLEASRIGVNPGLGFRPISKEAEEGSLIWYIAQNKTSVERWTNILDEFLEVYMDSTKLPGGGKNQQVCDFDKPPKPGKVCAVDVNNWGECSPKQGYSFNRSSPCLFIKLNKIYGWQPEFYNDPNDLPKDMPQDLKDYIKTIPELERNQIWITCQGEDPADREVLGNITYIPHRGLPSYYFPYTNTQGYISPLVAVRFLRPKVNVLINVECRAWAKNIVYHGGHLFREGSVHFELMID